MAKAIGQCEFMENAFPAGPLVLKGTFAVAEDLRGEHMIFSLDDRDRLCLILKGQWGQNEMVNLNTRFGLPDEHKVSAFAISQNQDGRIHLVFAARKPGSFDDLYVVRPLSSERQDWVATFSKSDIFSGTQTDMNIRQILLGTSNDSMDDATHYPQIYLVFRFKNKTTDDFWALTVNAQDKSWMNPNILQMPCNPDQILDKCPGNLKLYRGMFILYREVGTNSLQLRFVGYNPTKKNPTLTSIVQTVPEGATAIATLENPAGYTDLLVAGKKLAWRSAQECFTGSKADPTVLSDDPELAEPVQFHVAQSKSAFAMWSLNKSSLLAYQEFDIPSKGVPLKRTPLIPLLDRNASSDRFAALQHPLHGQKLFVIDKANTVKFMEQSNDTGLWQSPISVMIPQSDAMIKFKSHTIHLQVNDASGIALRKKKFNLCCSTSAELLVNGVSMRGSPEGQIVESDDCGTITVIIKSDGLSGPLITLKDESADVKVLASPFTIDPMKKLWTTVDGMDSPEKIKSMSLSDGSRFLKPNTSDQDVTMAVDALKKIRTARDDIKNPGSVPVPDKPDPPPRRKSGGLWGVWYFLRDKIEAVKDWVFEKIGAAWKFVVTIAGKIWEFVLENFPQIAEALQAVLDTIGKGLAWVRDKIFAVLGWDDIIDTKNILVNLTTQGLLWGADGLATLAEKADEAFNDMRKSVRALKQNALPPELTKIKPGKRPAEGGKLDKEEDTFNSPRAQYGNYHLKHSGTSLSGGSDGQSAVDRLIQRLSNVWTEIEQLVSRLGSNLADLFKDSNVSVENVLAKLGIDLLDDALGVIQRLVVELIGMMSDLLVDLADGLNNPINIPILSPLYKWLTQADLTILDLVCLVIAIPSTIMFKLMSGKKPKELTGVEELRRYNAMKNELDQRVGRARQDKSPSSGGSSKTAAGNSTSSQSSVMTSGNKLSVSSSINKSSVTASSNQNDHVKLNQKRFMKSAHHTSSLLKAGIPFGQMLWYQFYTWPRLFVEESYSPKKALLSAGAKLVLWFASFTSVAAYTKEQIAAMDFDLTEQWKDPWFAHRFRIWLVGGMPIIGAMGGKRMGYIIGMISSVVQSVMLAVLHVQAWTQSAGYSAYLCAEEWTKMAGKLATNFSGITQGGYGYGGVIALALTHTGSSLQMARCFLEFEGKRDVLMTGLDLE